MNAPSKIRLVVSNPTDPSDLAAVDPNDLEQVFRRYAPYVARVAMRILGNGDEVQDVVQDVFLDAQKGIGSLRDPNAVRFWLARIAVRKAHRRLRKRTMLRSIGLDRPSDFTNTLDPASASDHAAVIAVFRIRDGVPGDARIAWVLNRVEGESLDHVAEICGVSRATAHRRVQQAQAALKEGLRELEA